MLDMEHSGKEIPDSVLVQSLFRMSNEYLLEQSATTEHMTFVQRLLKKMGNTREFHLILAINLSSLQSVSVRLTGLEQASTCSHSVGFDNWIYAGGPGMNPYQNKSE